MRLPHLTYYPVVVLRHALTVIQPSQEGGTNTSDHAARPQGLSNSWGSVLLHLVPWISKSRSEEKHEVVEKEYTPRGL